MKLYVKFLKKGFVYGKERVRMFCAAFYVVYTMPLETPLLSSGKSVRLTEMNRYAKTTGGKKKFALSGLSGAFAI